MSHCELHKLREDSISQDEIAFPKLTSAGQRNRDLKLSVNYSRVPSEVKNIQAVENGDSTDVNSGFRATGLSLSGPRKKSCVLV